MAPHIPRLSSRILSQRFSTPRAIHPILRAPYIFRYASTSSPPPANVPIDPILNPAAPPTPPRAKSRRYVRTMITILSFFLVGAMGGGFIASVIIPPPLSLPDSEEDAAFLAKLKRDLATLPVVKELRSPESKAEGWVEYEAFMGLPEVIKDHHMSAGVLRGMRGLGLRRMWWNGKKRELVGVVFFGGGLAGWPGVVHGGAVATVLMEGIATVGNGGPQEIRGAMSQGDVGMMVSEFGIKYNKPTNANRVFVLRAGFEGDGDGLVRCSIEDVQTEKITAVATGRVGESSVIALGSGVEASTDSVLGRISKSIFG